MGVKFLCGLGAKSGQVWSEWVLYGATVPSLRVRDISLWGERENESKAFMEALTRFKDRFPRRAYG